MTDPAEAAVLTCAHAYAAADRAEINARHAYKLAQRERGTLAANVSGLHTAMLDAEDATREARSAMTRAVRALIPVESEFGVVAL